MVCSRYNAIFLVSHAIAAGGDTFQCYMTLWDSEEQRELGFNEFMRKLDDKTREWWKNEVRNSLPITLDFEFTLYQAYRFGSRVCQRMVA